MIKTHAIAALIGLLIGLGLMWYIQAGRVDAANQRTEVERQKVVGAQFDLQSCKSASDIQNKAIEDMRAKAEAAKAALAVAQTARTEAEERADQILQERTPANVDHCIAAQQSFAAELRKERGQ